VPPASSRPSVTPDNIHFPQEIKTVSHRFVQIYTEAAMAEQEKFYEVCGAGYRKALEFLIKDYCMACFPAEANQIKIKQLGYCIDKWVTDDAIRLIAKRALALGNDESHYIRKFPNRNLHDFKRLIGLVQLHILLERNAIDISTALHATTQHKNI